VVERLFVIVVVVALILALNKHTQSKDDHRLIYEDDNDLITNIFEKRKRLLSQ
jgi:hypothetical protein